MDIGAELGASIFVLWGGREGVETDACRRPDEAVKRLRDAVNFLCEYSIDRKYGFRFALEAKPNEPRGDIYMATTGAYLGFIPTLAHPEMVGVNPEVAHEQMAGLNFVHAVAQAWEAGKLFHIDLNDQIPGRYDQDFRFGSANIKSSFFLVKFLEDVGYDGPRHFDAHAYRTEDYDGVRDFARGCMRTYLILRDKAKQWNADARFRRWCRRWPVALPTGPYSPQSGTRCWQNRSIARRWPARDWRTSASTSSPSTCCSALDDSRVGRPPVYSPRSFVLRPWSMVRSRLRTKGQRPRTETRDEGQETSDSSRAFKVKQFRQFGAHGTVVRVRRHQLAHVPPPSSADLGRCHRRPALLALELDIREQIARRRIEKNGVREDTVIEKRPLELRPDRLVARRVLALVAGMHRHAEGATDHDGGAISCGASCDR